MTILTGFIFSFLSTVGFGIITNVPRRVLLYAGMTGAFGWTVYLLAESVTSNLILPNFLAALTIGLLGNVAAIRVKAPVNMIYVPSLVSLVPGVIIYTSLKEFALGNYMHAGQNLVKTLVIALAIDIGFAIAESLFKRVYQFVK
ncbi:threonine/serine exporter family protein [Weissella sagaensis]|uniref:Threonine/serine exporter family protein n=1 Tax=Weissella sagaensis TaxID=2559928 RepID=A0ABW1RR78_9LACO|nr:threonine/serine exporter family protein [Weissella sagaensis]KAA8434894.1 threonine/serine exporter [Weissella paramesenteroides]MBU7568821.1 threonine/serine exporter family protein [Weissella hellenica]KAA8436850.1 threonine/serine exporter [Weissella paramesenteroides]QDJ58048.1 threonine/serine exporter [Weissella hellenica]QEA57045.1 threonine/serine exporter [Weissella hellenica]